MSASQFRRELSRWPGPRAPQRRDRPPGSAHRPTVSNGRALVLYLLPEGRIDFTR